MFKWLIRITFTAALLPLLAPFPAHGQEEDGIQVLEAAPVIVTAPKEPLMDDSAIFMTVINVSAEDAVAKSLAEILDYSVGLKIKKYAGLESFSVAYIRGASPNQVAIFLNGVPLNSAKSGIVSLGDIPLSNIEKIEIYRGFTPPEFNVSAMGGVINLVTKKGSGKKAIEGSAGVGSFNTLRANATLSYPSGPYNFTLHADMGKSEGNYPYLNNNGTPFNGGDDTWDKRENNRFEYGNISARLLRNLGKWRVSLFDDYYSKKSGVPGLGSFQSKNALFELKRNSLQLNLDEDITSDYVNFSGGLSHTYTVENFTDKAGEIGLGRQKNENVSERIGLNTKAALTSVFENHYIVFAGSAFNETFNAANLLVKRASEPERVRRNYSFTVLDEMNLESWFISASMRYELYENDFGGDVFFKESGGAPSSSGAYDFISPKLGVGRRMGDWLTIKGNIGKYFRAPDMTELFGDRGVVVGNTDLNPEEGINFDFGARANIEEFISGSGFLEVTYFQTEAKNLIAYTQNSQRTSKAQNVGKAQIMGLEISSAIATENGLKFSFNYTYQDARDKSDIPHFNGAQLPDRPRNDLYAKLEKTYGKWRGFFETSYTDLIYLDRANVRKIEDSAIHNTGLSLLTRWYGVRLAFEIKNILDERVEDEIGYPLPGRSYFLTVEWKHNLEK